MNEILRFEDLDYYYQDGNQQVEILKKASQTFEAGKIYAIVGASGSGKTTSLVLAGGLDQPKAGKIYFKGRDIQEMGLTVYRQKEISIVFQSYNLIYYMNAYQNVLNALSISKVKIPDKKQYALQVLGSLGLNESLSTRDIRKLSGGQQQRVAIARAIARDVDLILADEPTGNLDSKTAKEIIRLFIDLAHKQNKCIILVTHSQEIAKKCDVVIQIKEGKLIPVN
ncbi:MAG: ABC transporter ATP-binding protein [Beduini sp.]|uniref:ABC transporter ATP-binding protein n=1 Tax=Beduini sp. TaxID=1922300 RepID=UPI0039A0862A